jgi:magnesium transporter
VSGKRRRRRLLRRLRANSALQGLRVAGRKRRRPPVGARPGEFAALPADALALSIRVMRYTPGEMEEFAVDSPEALAPIVADRARVSWIDVQGLGDGKALERIGQLLEIHALAMADVVNVPQRPKAELHGERLLVITRMAQLGAAGAVDLEQVSLVLGPSWVATFQERERDVFDGVRARIRIPTMRVRQMGADFLAYALLDAVIDGYFPVVEMLGSTIEALEHEVIEAPERGTLGRIYGVRRTLLDLHRIQWRQRDAVAALERDPELPISAAVRVYLRDTHDHASETVDMLESYRDMSVSLMDVYLSSSSNRMNEAIKTLTVVASLFIPLTFIVGVYGMNFDYMPELHWRYGYAATWGAMIAVGGGFLAWLRWRHWL